MCVCVCVCVCVRARARARTRAGVGVGIVLTSVVWRVTAPPLPSVPQTFRSGVRRSLGEQSHHR